MNRFCAWSSLLIVGGMSGLAAGRAPLIDPPTPPACAADGTCYPNTCEWGYYPARWRTWPGSQLEPTASKSPTGDGQVSPELSHTEPPPAELEDAAAPPSSPKREEPSEKPPVPGEEPPAGEGDESTMPNVPLPDDEASPLGPTSDQDPPPSLPRSLSAQTRSPVPRQAATAIRPQPTATKVSTGDPAPAPPWAQSAAL